MKNLLKLALTGVFLLLSLPPVVFADVMTHANFRELSPLEHGIALKNDRSVINFFDKKVELEFPAGSLAKTHEISAVKVSFSYLSPGFKQRGEIVDFGPSMKFRKQALLRMSYDGMPDADESRYEIFFYNNDRGIWEKTEKISQDIQGNTICSKISHFSSYCVGEGSYRSIQEGTSNFSLYFQNTSERVEGSSGSLFLSRRDFFLSGRAGLDLSLESEFYSKNFYYAYLDENPSWSFEADKTMNNFAAGWRWRLPGFQFDNIKTGSTVTGRKFYYFSSNAKRFELPVTSVVGKAIGEMVYASGCRIFKTSKAVTNGYNVVIELPEEKTTFSADVTAPNSASMTFTPSTYLPDSHIFTVYPITGSEKYAGKIHELMDSSQANKITYTYNSLGDLSQIEDSVSRIISFSYDTSNRITSIMYDNKAFAQYTYEGTTKKLTSFSQLVQETDGDDIYQTTTYNYDNTNKTITITFPSAGISQYSFGNLYNSGSSTIISNPGSTIYLNTYTYQPVVKSHTLKANGKDTGKTISYDYLGGTIYTDANSTQYGIAYYSLLKELNYTDTTAIAWRPWSNYTIKYYGEAVANGATIYGVTIDGESITGAPGIFTESEYCIMRSEVSDARKKSVSCYNFASGVFKGIEREVTYTKSGSFFVIDRITVNEFADINTYSDWFQVSKSSVYHNPTNDLNPGTSQCNINSTFDSLGRVLTSKDLEANRTEYTYLYPNNMSGTGPDGATYTNKLNKLNILYKVVKKQKTGIEFVVDQETFFYYDDKDGNLLKERKYKKSFDGSTSIPVDLLYTYDPANNNLLAITDPKVNVISLEYETAYNAYVSKDFRSITPAVEFNSGIIVTGIVNEFSYDNLGRLKTKRTAYTDVNGSVIPGFTSETTNYTYDFLGRTTEVHTGSSLKKYVYDDTVNTLTAYSLVENLGSNTYLAVKNFQRFDGLDRKIAEETSRLSVTLDSGNAITELADEALIWKKRYAYHPVFLDKVAKTTLYEDATTAARITEIIYDAYARPLEIKANNIILKTFSYGDAANIITEKNYRDASAFTLKKIKKDWNNNVTTKYEWDTVSPSGDTGTAFKTAYSYDAFGNITKTENPAGEEFYHYYNALGQVEKTVYNKGTDDETFELATYDRNGNLIEFRDRMGNKITHEYNSLNQITSTKTYNVAELTNPETVTEMVYGQFGAPINITRTNATGQRDYEYKYTYNALGQLATYEQFVGSESDYKHYSITNTYDLAENPDTTKLWDGEPGVMLIKALDYDPLAAGNENAVYELIEAGKGDLLAKVKTKLWGGIESIKYGISPAMKTSYNYNSLLQPTRIINSGRMSLSYAYDFQGNVLCWTNETVKTFTYDGLDKLLTETAGTATDKYSYDAIGNRTAIDKGNDGLNDVTYTYNSVKKMLLDSCMDDSGIPWTFTYDRNGNTTGKSSKATSWIYRYNVQNQLTEVHKDGSTIGRYEYDSNGLRIKKVVNGTATYYIYNSQSILFEETYDNANTLKKREYNVELNGMNLAKFVWDEANGWQLNFHLNDHLGSRQVVCDANGMVFNNGKYGSFGEYKSGSPNEASYTGKKYDIGISLYYHNARYYDAELGRFLSLDSIKEGDCWYIYCLNNPVRYIDNNGLYVTDGGNSTINSIVQTMYNKSITFREIVNSAAKNKDMVLQFSIKKLSGNKTVAETNPRKDEAKEGSVPAKTIDDNGKIQNTIIPAGKKLAIIFVNIDLNKCLDIVKANNLPSADYIMKVISQEMGHVNDALNLGIEGFWQQVKKEESIDYVNRPSEQNAYKIAEKIINEMEAD